MEKSNERKETKKRLAFPRAFKFEEKIDGPKAVCFCGTICDGHFFVEINPI